VNGEGTGGRTQVMILAIGVEGGLAVLALLVGRVLHQPPLETLSADPVAALVGLVATAPLVLAFFAMIRWPVGPLAGIRRFSTEILCPVLAPCTVADLGVIAVLAGLGEEMLFRGALQGALTRGTGPWVALAIASMLFGIVHAVTPSYAVLATLMGAYLGWLWQLTGNILTPIVVHALYDFVALYYLLAGPGRSLWANQEMQGGAAESSEPGSDSTI
jgi:membrane protease YdiL (CAAX protease family)